MLDVMACQDVIQALLVRAVRDLVGSDEELREAAGAFLQSEDARHWCDLIGLDLDQLLQHLKAMVPGLTA